MVWPAADLERLAHQVRGGKLTVIDGRVAETKELIAGHSVIQVKSRAEVLEWTKRFPNRVERQGRSGIWGPWRCRGTFSASSP
jgi:hypothetical protein